ncbi:radical SAM protein [Natranaerobius trueperi]|uniref:biotin synthase n=1 Tax=Natranaerobius trueperi TaxID=759412 RepID=A0A226BYC8_9FIRM|nr:radical SAM protein [Natranaerobius trueperi]OWZ84038.1 radical SAM protein [Natranaerobius trueperi]
MIRISAGSAYVCGLNKLKTDAMPTTAYLMDGENCLNNCSFCPQSRSSLSKSNLLSRITWPEYSKEDLKHGLAEGERNGLKRVCLQSVKEDSGHEKTQTVLNDITQMTNLPICVSANIESVEQVKDLINQGADKVGISLDVCDPNKFNSIKGGFFEERFKLIKECALKFPDKISTHLIVGLGESEQQVIELLSELIYLGVHVGLFAFTPIKGTKLENESPPDIKKYRIIQTVHYLLRYNYITYDDIIFDNENRVIKFGIESENIKNILKDGEAFETTGCPDCNRPYYNEKPGGIIYNYPRSLTSEEAQNAVKLVLSRIET